MSNLGNGLPYIPSGFRLDGSIEEGDIVWYPQKAVSVKQGDAMFQTGGYATNVGTAFAATFIGVAGFTQDNSAGTDGAVNIMVIKPNRQKLFWVPVGSAAVVTAAAVGTKCDLKTNHSVDITANTPTAYAFEIVDWDASTLATNANASGFVKGFFKGAGE